MGADFLDSIQGLATLKAFGQSSQRGRDLAERARQLYRSTMWVLAVNIGTGGITLLGISAGAAVALGWGALRVQSGAAVRCRRCWWSCCWASKCSVRCATWCSCSTAACSRWRPRAACTSCSTRCPRSSRPRGRSLPSTLAPVVALRARHLRLPGWTACRPSRTARSSSQPGQTLGVVGPSGAGQVDAGQPAAALRRSAAGAHSARRPRPARAAARPAARQVAVVAQDTYLFYGTVADNLRVARPHATAAELESACRAANAHDFISALPRGYDTVIGERGVRLSGGQRQRLAIARALLKDAPILVLDEALSSVDAENEATIQQALERLQRGRTTLVIAHRLSSVANADRIVVLEHGRVAEEGAPAELMAQELTASTASLMAAQQTAIADHAQLSTARMWSTRYPPPTLALGSWRAPRRATATATAARAHVHHAERRNRRRWSPGAGAHCRLDRSGAACSSSCGRGGGRRRWCSRWVRQARSRRSRWVW